MQPNADEEAVKQALDGNLQRAGGQDVVRRDELPSEHFLANEIQQLKVMSLVLPAIFLSVAAFLLHVLLSRLIRVQRHPIALLKAFGYHDAEIMRHYLSFSVVIVTAGVVLGAAPAESMRPPIPDSYTTAPIETRFARSQTSRMVVRHMVRHRWRSLLSVVGIAVAGALLTFGSYMTTAFDDMLLNYFGRNQGMDLELVFAEFVMSIRSVLHAIQRWVWKSSGFAFLSASPVNKSAGSNWVRATESRQKFSFGIVIQPCKYRLVHSFVNTIAGMCLWSNVVARTCAQWESANAAECSNKYLVGSSKARGL